MSGRSSAGSAVVSSTGTPAGTVSSARAALRLGVARGPTHALWPAPIRRPSSGSRGSIERSGPQSTRGPTCRAAPSASSTRRTIARPPTGTSDLGDPQAERGALVALAHAHERYPSGAGPAHAETPHELEPAEGPEATVQVPDGLVQVRQQHAHPPRPPRPPP